MFWFLLQSHWQQKEAVCSTGLPHYNTKSCQFWTPWEFEQSRKDDSGFLTILLGQPSLKIVTIHRLSLLKEGSNEGISDLGKLVIWYTFTKTVFIYLLSKSLGEELSMEGLNGGGDRAPEAIQQNSGPIANQDIAPWKAVWWPSADSQICISLLQAVDHGVSNCSIYNCI